MCSVNLLDNMCTVEKSRCKVLWEVTKVNFSFCPQCTFDLMEEFTVDMIFSILDLLCISFYRVKNNNYVLKSPSKFPTQTCFSFPSVDCRNESCQIY